MQPAEESTPSGFSGRAGGKERRLPYRAATLLYCFDGQDRALLIRRAFPPNRGLWSPCGGKVRTDQGESPYACASREAREELGLELRPSDLHLTGLVSEEAYEGRTHWLMFLFEVKPRLERLPPPHREGRFGFFTREEIAALPIPETDRKAIWPLFWRHRGGFFAAHCRYDEAGAAVWEIEERVEPPGKGR